MKKVCLFLSAVLFFLVTAYGQANAKTMVTYKNFKVLANIRTQVSIAEKAMKWMTSKKLQTEKKLMAKEKESGDGPDSDIEITAYKVVWGDFGVRYPMIKWGSEITGDNTDLFYGIGMAVTISGTDAQGASSLYRCEITYNDNERAKHYTEYVTKCSDPTTEVCICADWDNEAGRCREFSDKLWFGAQYWRDEDGGKEGLEPRERVRVYQIDQETNDYLHNWDGGAYLGLPYDESYVCGITGGYMDDSSLDIEAQNFTISVTKIDSDPLVGKTANLGAVTFKVRGEDGYLPYERGCRMLELECIKDRVNNGQLDISAADIDSCVNQRDNSCRQLSACSNVGDVVAGHYTLPINNGQNFNTKISCKENDDGNLRFDYECLDEPEYPLNDWFDYNENISPLLFYCDDQHKLAALDLSRNFGGAPQAGRGCDILYTDGSSFNIPNGNIGTYEGNPHDLKCFAGDRYGLDQKEICWLYLFGPLNIFHTWDMVPADKCRVEFEIRELQ